MTKRLLRSAGRRLSPSKSYTASAVLDFASVAANTRGTGLTVAMPGVLPGDQVDVVPAAGAPANAGIDLQGYVTAADTVTVYPFNVTAGAIDPASATYNVTVRRAGL